MNQVFVNPQARCIDLATCFAMEKGITLIVSAGMADKVQALLEKRIFPADEVGGSPSPLRMPGVGIHVSGPVGLSEPLIQQVDCLAWCSFDYKIVS